MGDVTKRCVDVWAVLDVIDVPWNPWSMDSLISDYFRCSGFKIHLIHCPPTLAWPHTPCYQPPCTTYILVSNSLLMFGLSSLLSLQKLCIKSWFRSSTVRRFVTQQTTPSWTKAFNPRSAHWPGLEADAVIDVQGNQFSTVFVYILTTVSKLRLRNRFRSQNLIYIQESLRQEWFGVGYISFIYLRDVLMKI